MEHRKRLTQLSRRRVELRGSMSALEHALASPAGGEVEAWADRVRTALLELSTDLRVHVAITEGSEGLYRQLERHAPRLAGPVETLAREHIAITRELEHLLRAVDKTADACDVELVRRFGTELFGALMRHRQRDADIVYEAYEFDVGGEN